MDPTQVIRWMFPLSLVGLVGCASTPVEVDAANQREMLALLMPSRIEIVEPFTKIRSFDAENIPDGIELLIRAVNSLDNPGLMVAGTMNIELYEYVPASADQKGKRIDRWDIELTSEEHQRRYWNQITQMYEFQLDVDAKATPHARRFVLAVTYNSPLGDHLSDECVVEYREAPGSRRSSTAVRR